MQALVSRHVPSAGHASWAMSCVREQCAPTCQFNIFDPNTPSSVEMILSHHAPERKGRLGPLLLLGGTAVLATPGACGHPCRNFRDFHMLVVRETSPRTGQGRGAIDGSISATVTVLHPQAHSCSLTSHSQEAATKATRLCSSFLDHRSSGASPTEGIKRMCPAPSKAVGQLCTLPPAGGRELYGEDYNSLVLSTRPSPVVCGPASWVMLQLPALGLRDVPQMEAV